MSSVKMADGEITESTELIQDRPRRFRIGSRLLLKRSTASNFVFRYAVLLAWGMLIVLFGVLESSTFLTTENFATIFGSQSVLAVLTLGLLLPLTAGDYDLSVAATLSLSAMTIAVLNAQHGWTISAAIAIALLIGVGVGLFNGALIILVGVDSLIVTLASGTILSGIVFWISNSETIAGVSPGLSDWVVIKTIFGISLSFYYALAVCVGMWYVFEYTPVGRRLLFVGRGRSVARLIGVRVARVRWGALLASGVISALAGVLWVGNTGAADPVSGQTLLLPAFAAAFLGATTVIPGQFNPWGSMIAVYFLVTGITGLQLLGAQSYVQDLFYGGALATSVALSQLARRHQAPSDSGG